MPRFGRNFGQRLQHKPALVHGRMRNLQARFVYDTIPEEHDVDIDFAWPLARVRTRPIASSIDKTFFNSSWGVLPVSIVTTQFRNHG